MLYPLANICPNSYSEVLSLRMPATQHRHCIMLQRLHTKQQQGKTVQFFSSWQHPAGSNLLSTSACITYKIRHTTLSGFSNTRQKSMFERPSLFVQYSDVKASASYSFASGNLLI